MKTARNLVIIPELQVCRTLEVQLDGFFEGFKVF